MTEELRDMVERSRLGMKDEFVRAMECVVSVRKWSRAR